MDTTQEQLNISFENIKTDLVQYVVQAFKSSPEPSRDSIQKDIINYIHHIPTPILSMPEKKKRNKNTIQLCERCTAVRDGGGQCTRKRLPGTLFCGTHIKGKLSSKGEVITPDAQCAEENAKNSYIVDAWSVEMNGIIRFIDGSGNVYNTKDIIERKPNPRVIAKYTCSEDGKYSLLS